MIKMRFQLGVMDLHPISANKTVMENNPFFQVKLKEGVSAERLHTAVKQALGQHPLFDCKMQKEAARSIDRGIRGVSKDSGRCEEKLTRIVRKPR